MATTIHSEILSLCAARGEVRAFALQRESGPGYRVLTWREYRDKVLRFSAYLQSKGIGHGDRVLLISENGPEWTIAALAVMNLGATLVPVASIASVLEIQNIMRGARPKFSIGSVRCPVRRQIEEELKAEFPNYLFWDLQKDEPLEEWISGVDPIAVNDSVSEDDQAVLIYTSGTTGHPKAVPISHKNILTNARDVLTVIEASGRDRLVSVLPLSHMLEFTGGFVVPTLIGAQITYVKSLKPEDLLAGLRDTKATILIAVPLLFEIIARNLKAKLDGLPGPIAALFRSFEKITRAVPPMGPILFFPIHRALGGHLRYFMAGGSKLHPQVFEFYRGLGILLLQGYGLTETSPVLTVTSPKNAGADHVGRALPSVEVGIFNDAGERLSPGLEGEIWARGPNVFRGYLDPEHTKGVFSGDWFKTGDLGTMDPDGLLRITGRKKDIIVTAAGKNVYPEEIEGVVGATGQFLEVSVLGIQDGAGHEKICLVAVPDRSKFLGQSQDEIRKECESIAAEACRTLSEYKWPQRVEILFEELPKTITRKVKKHEVRKLLLEKEKAGVSETVAVIGGGLDPKNELEQTIANGIAAITKIDPAKIRLQDSLTKDLGLDSLTFVELVSSVEKKFGIQIEGVDFSAIQSVQDLVAALQFAAASRKKKSLFDKVFFADFTPRENLKALWRLPRRMLNVVLRAFLKIRHGMEVEGLENIRDGGPYVFAPNHTSHFDMLSIAGSIPGPLLHWTFAVAAKDYFFNKTWKALFTRIFLNAIPFDRKGRVDESMCRCREALEIGGSLTIFPEGTRSPDGKLQPFKPGVGQLLAGHPKARAVPVYIEGAYQIMPKGSKCPRPGKLRVRYGKPISFRDLPASPESYRIIAERLREEVVALSRAKN